MSQNNMVNSQAQFAIAMASENNEFKPSFKAESLARIQKLALIGQSLGELIHSELIQLSLYAVKTGDFNISENISFLMKIPTIKADCVLLWLKNVALFHVTVENKTQFNNELQKEVSFQVIKITKNKSKKEPVHYDASWVQNMKNKSFINLVKVENRKDIFILSIDSDDNIKSSIDKFAMLYAKGETTKEKLLLDFSEKRVSDIIARSKDSKFLESERFKRSFTEKELEQRALNQPEIVEQVGV